MMNNKAINELEAYYCRFPEWYWKYGLHDAEIKAIEYKYYDDKADLKNQRYNCIEITVDSSDSCENNIKAIRFINCSIINDVPVIRNKTWWLTDELKTLTESLYEINIMIEDSDGSHTEFRFNFKITEVCRI